jgi:hypothetical protein
MTEIHSDNYFAIVPEWIIDSDVSANAIRLYAILNRYANSRGQAFPTRATLAKRMSCSTDTVDRAKQELVEIGALTIQRRTTDAGDPTSNLYTIHTFPVDNGENSADVRKGTGNNAQTGTGKNAEQKRANMNHSQFRQDPHECELCQGLGIVIGSWDPESNTSEKCSCKL